MRSPAIESLQCDLFLLEVLLTKRKKSIGLTAVARQERRYMGLFPNLIARGCHTKQPRPKNKNIYPVPEFRSFSVRTVAFDIGVRTE